MNVFNFIVIKKDTNNNTSVCALLVNCEKPRPQPILVLGQTHMNRWSRVICLSK